MVNFPTSLDSLTNPTSSDKLNSPAHASQHADANDILEALEAKIGVDGSAVSTSQDYKIRKGLGIQADTPSGGNVTVDLASKNIHSIAMNAATITIALSNVSVGQVFILRLVQDATGSRAASWFSTIKWADGTAPTLTTTANKTDVFGFICTSSGNYDGFILGQNL